MPRIARTQNARVARSQTASVPARAARAPKVTTDFNALADELPNDSKVALANFLNSLINANNVANVADVNEVQTVRRGPGRPPKASTAVAAPVAKTPAPRGRGRSASAHVEDAPATTKRVRLPEIEMTFSGIADFIQDPVVEELISNTVDENMTLDDAEAILYETRGISEEGVTGWMNHAGLQRRRANGKYLEQAQVLVATCEVLEKGLKKVDNTEDLYTLIEDLSGTEVEAEMTKNEMIAEIIALFVETTGAGDAVAEGDDDDAEGEPDDIEEGDDAEGEPGDEVESFEDIEQPTIRRAGRPARTAAPAGKPARRRAL